MSSKMSYPASLLLRWEMNDVVSMILNLELGIAKGIFAALRF